MDVSRRDKDLVDQAESILIHEFKNFNPELGDMMIDNSAKADSYIKYYVTCINSSFTLLYQDIVYTLLYR